MRRVEAGKLALAKVPPAKPHRDRQDDNNEENFLQAARAIIDEDEWRATAYRSSSITCSSTSRPGRTTDAGSVASGWSVMFSMSMKVGAFVLT